MTSSVAELRNEYAAMQDGVDLIFGRGMAPRRLLPSRAGPETRPRKSNHGTRDGCDPGTGGSLHAFVHSSRKVHYNVCNAYPWPFVASYGAAFCRRARPVNGASCRRMYRICGEHFQADVDKIDMTCRLYTNVPSREQSSTRLRGCEIITDRPV